MRRLPKTDLIVGIPTRNESGNIEKIVKIIDEGLSQFSATLNPVIFNADNGSSDRTKEIFDRCETVCQKFSVVTSKRLGKGSNILTMLSYSLECNARYLILIDADTITANKSWIIRMVTSLISTNADLVTPKYKRNRFEANTTNHFCYPILKAWFRWSVQQPIGGDFGLNLRFVKHLLAQKINSSILNYGIDIFIVLQALLGNFKIHEVNLGQKFHRPSFHNLLKMFDDVATVLVQLLRKKSPIISIPDNELIQRRTAEKIVYINPEQIEQLNYTLRTQFRRTKFTKCDWIQKRTDQILLAEWVDILNSLLYNISTNERFGRTKDIVRCIKPFFGLRVLSHLNTIKSMNNANEIDNLIEHQANLLKKQFTTLLKSY